MFDIATRPTRSPAASPMLLGMPFDWQMATPLPAEPLPWHDYSAPNGQPAHYAQQLAVYALTCEDALATAVTISLFTDARAGDDDALPWGSTERRGWLGDAYIDNSFDTRPDRWGNHLWLLYVSKATVNVLERARFTAHECLQWLVRDGLASRVDVAAQWVNEVLAVRPTIYQAGSSNPVYDVLWGTSIRRNMGAV